MAQIRFTLIQGKVYVIFIARKLTARIYGSRIEEVGRRLAVLFHSRSRFQASAADVSLLGWGGLNLTT